MLTADQFGALKIKILLISLLTMFVWQILAIRGITPYLFGEPAIAAGGIYFVSPNGSGVSTDTNSPGSVSATIAKMCDGSGTAIVGGDTIRFKDGTYPISAYGGTFSISNKKCASGNSYIKLVADNLHKAIIKRDVVYTPQNNYWYTVSFSDSSNVEISGFELVGANTPVDQRDPGYGIAGRKCQNIRVINNIIHDFGGGGVSTVECTHHYIEGNEIYNTSTYDPFKSSAISLFEGENPNNLPVDSYGYANYIIRNRVYNNQNMPTLNNPTDGNCVIFDYQWEHNYTLQSLVANNECFANGGRGVVMTWSNHADIINNTFYLNNQSTFANPWAEIGAGCWGNSGGSNEMKDIRFINNLIWTDANDTPASIGSYGCSITNVLFHNNIFLNKNPDPGSVSGAQYTATTNGADLGTTCGSNLIDTAGAAANFVSPGMTDAASFVLGAGSVAIDKSCNFSAAVAAMGDLRGYPRQVGARIDVGAHEYTTSTAPPVCTVFKPTD